jgi:hypothetical protein
MRREKSWRSVARRTRKKAGGCPGCRLAGRSRNKTGGSPGCRPPGGPERRRADVPAADRPGGPERRMSGRPVGRTSRKADVPQGRTSGCRKADVPKAGHPAAERRMSGRPDIRTGPEAGCPEGLPSGFLKPDAGQDDMRCGCLQDLPAECRMILKRAAVRFGTRIRQAGGPLLRRTVSRKQVRAGRMPEAVSRMREGVCTESRICSGASWACRMPRRPGRASVSGTAAAARSVFVPRDREQGRLRARRALSPEAASAGPSVNRGAVCYSGATVSRAGLQPEAGPSCRVRQP